MPAGAHLAGSMPVTRVIVCRGARTSDRKMGVLWIGLLRPAAEAMDSNGGSGGIVSLLRDERKLSAFAVLDCAHSREAATQLPSALEAVQVHAEEAGASVPWFIPALWYCCTARTVCAAFWNTLLWVPAWRCAFSAECVALRLLIMIHTSWTNHMHTLGLRRF